MIGHRLSILAVLLAMAAAPAVQAGSLPGTYTLGRYIPADVWMYVHGVHNDEAAFLEQEWSEVIAAFKESGIVEDVKTMIMTSISDEDRAQAETAIATATELLKGVKWGDLVKHEFAFAYRFRSIKVGGEAGQPGMDVPIPDYIFLFRGAKESLDANVTGLVAILRQIDSLTDKVELVKVDGENRWSLVIAGGSYTVDLVFKDDVVGLVLGISARQDVMALMNGGGEGQSVLNAPRFKLALAQIPSPEDAIAYFDVKALMEVMRGYLKIGAAKAAEKEGDDKAAVMKAFNGILDTFDFVDYVVTSTETEGRRQLTHELTTLQPERKNAPFAKLLWDRKPIEKFDTYIPAEATGFSVGNGIDWGALYALARDFVKTNVPEGESILAKVDGAMAEVGFDPQRDIFSWISGEYISVSLPATVVTPMGGGDGVLMLQVRDAQAANERINKGLDWVQAKMQGHQGQALMIGPAADVEAEGFRSISHPMMMMFGGLRPVFGIKDNWLILGTSAASINKCLATAKGTAPSVLKNERFTSEGVVPKGPICSASFTDLSNLGQELATVLASLGMAGIFMPPTPEVEPVRKVFNLLMKLGPVVQKLDFFSSESSVTTFKDLAWRTESVIAYKQPPPPPPPSPPGSPAPPAE